MDLLIQADQPHRQYSPETKKRAYKKRASALRGPQRKYRPIAPHPDDTSKRSIALTKGKIATVDAYIYDWLIESNWYARFDKSSGAFYAVRNSATVNGKKSIIFMHREIMGLPHGDPREGDHQNHDTLDNIGQNLRIVNELQSATNRRRFRKNLSGFKGVSWYKNLKKWVAQIQMNGKKINLGYYDTAEGAARAYDAAAVLYHGAYAVLNFPLSA